MIDGDLASVVVILRFAPEPPVAQISHWLTVHQTIMREDGRLAHWPLLWPVLLLSSPPARLTWRKYSIPHQASKGEQTGARAPIPIRAKNLSLTWH